MVTGVAKIDSTALADEACRSCSNEKPFFACQAAFIVADRTTLGAFSTNKVGAYIGEKVAFIAFRAITVGCTAETVNF